MIFVTVGSQSPFDRLISAVDEWASMNRSVDILAQIAGGTYCPRHMRFTKFMTPKEFAQTIESAQVIVSHAGMGTIISALELGKQVVVMPRLARLRETRNDHQVATVRHFGEQGRLLVANDGSELPGRLEYAITLGETERITNCASPRLLQAIRSFLETDVRVSRFSSSIGKSGDLALPVQSTIPWDKHINPK